MDLHPSITYHITKCGNILRQLSAKKIKAAGIDVTPEESVFLNQLWDKDKQTLTELGEWSVEEASTVTRQIDALVHKGYVERINDTEDRRRIYAQLTEKGRQLQSTWEKTGISRLDRSLQGISAEELAITLKVIRQIRQQALNDSQSSL